MTFTLSYSFHFRLRSLRKNVSLSLYTFRSIFDANIKLFTTHLSTLNRFKCIFTFLCKIRPYITGREDNGDAKAIDYILHFHVLMVFLVSRTRDAETVDTTV